MYTHIRSICMLLARYKAQQKDIKHATVLINTLTQTDRQFYNQKHGQHSYMCGSKHCISIHMRLYERVSSKFILHRYLCI